MKALFPFILLALAACGGEPISGSEDETPPSEQSSEQPPDTVYDESTGEAQDVVSVAPAKNKMSQYANDPLIRFLVCNYIPIQIDTNPVTGEGIYLIKWDCPQGFH